MARTAGRLSCSDARGRACGTTVAATIRRLIGMEDVPLKEFDTITQGHGSYDVALQQGARTEAADGEFGIYLCGGSRLAGELVDEIDELVGKTYPIVYGTGVPMFGSGFPVTEFELDEVRTFDNGVLVRTYSRKR